MFTKIFQKMYKELKANFLGSSSNLVPERYWSNFVNIGGAFEANYIIWRLLKEGGIKTGKVLIIGVSGGRDYYGLLVRGYEIYGFDLVDLPGFQRLKIGNVEESLPYPDQEFDAIVMGEILEHLKEDVRALENVKRVLKENGVLIVTVPFLNDESEYHLRVHTKKSCSRLLRSCGFKILRIVERPGIAKTPFWLNRLHHLIGWIFLKICGFLPHKIILPLWARIEFKVGQIENPIRRWSSGFGGYYLCKKSAVKEYDHLQLNLEHFGRE